MMKLENKTDPLVPECTEVFIIQITHVSIAYNNVARIRLIQRTQDIKQGTLSGTGSAQDGDYFTLLYLKVYPFKYL